MQKEILKGIDLFLRPNPRTKSFRLTINKDGQPVLSFPTLSAKRRALQWAESQVGWIQKHAFTPQKFAFGQKFLLLSQEVCLTPSPNRTSFIQGKILYISGETAFVHRRTKDFIKKMLLPLLQKKVQEKATLLGTPYRRISIKDTSSRWGSCSSQGNLSFCWRIALAPAPVLDYLVAHEVSHLRHMNHGPLFWKTVATLTPHTLMAKRWLKKNSTTLPK